MQGLEIAEKYYKEFGQAAIAQVLQQFPQVKPAAGLVGEGSQCFGFDDALSRDHDFAPGFCIWLSDQDMEIAGSALQQAYDKLPASYLGISRDNMIANGRLGVLSIGSFYRQFTGCAGTEALPGAPQRNIDWFMAPENALAVATNGKVFCDDSGLFTAVRRHLLSFYPDDILRKKIAARAAVMSQAGQYNLLRLIRRNDKTAALLAAGKFCEASLSMIYLLNRRYTPFYKWAYYGLKELTVLTDTGRKLEELPDILTQIGSNNQTTYDKAFALTEEICKAVAAQLRVQGFSNVQSDFLQDHLGAIMSGITDPQIRSMPPMADYNN